MAKKEDLSTYNDTTYSKTLGHYFYEGQLRKHLVQAAAVFTELQVKIGKNDFKSQTDLITVPVKIGSMDRVVAAIMAGNTQNKNARIPMLVLQMTGLEIAYDYIKGSNQVKRETKFPVGGTLPDDGKVIYSYMPFPFWLNFEVTILASNEYQHQQILEQILLLFNPDLQLQISDAFADWTKITHIELLDINLETPYPLELDRRIITTTLNFKSLVYLSPAINLKDNYIKRIKLRISEVSTNENFDDYFIENIPGAPDEYQTIIDIDKLGIPPR